MTHGLVTARLSSAAGGRVRRGRRAPDLRRARRGGLARGPRAALRDHGRVML